MIENVDSLLDDLDALIGGNNKQHPSVNSSAQQHSNNNNGAPFSSSFSSYPERGSSSGSNSSGGENNYKIPRRPSNEKSPSNNPKTKFAIVPPTTSNLTNRQSASNFRSENILNNQNVSSTSSSSGVKDMESIDSLLDLLDYSPPSQHQPSQHQTSSQLLFPPNNGNIEKSTQILKSTNVMSSPHYEYTSSTPTRPSAQSTAPSKHTSTHDSTLDSLLSDLNNSLPPVSPHTKQEPHASSYTSMQSASLLQPPTTQYIPPSTKAASGGARCSRVVVSGSQTARGLKSSAFSKCACDRLRCLKCNFEAIQFSGQEWSSNVDYMFFRNNMPNREKLSPQLLQKSTSVAYCCQCSWISTEEEVVLSAGAMNRPQWVCAGH